MLTDTLAQSSHVQSDSAFQRSSTTASLPAPYRQIQVCPHAVTVANFPAFFFPRLATVVIFPALDTSFYWLFVLFTCVVLLACYESFTLPSKEFQKNQISREHNTHTQLNTNLFSTPFNPQQFSEAKPCTKDAKCGSHATCMLDPMFPKSPICKCDVGFKKTKNGKCVGKFILAQSEKGVCFFILHVFLC